MTDRTTYDFLIAGSAAEPYPLAVRIDADGEVRVRCGCPAGERQRRLCKHVVALFWADDPPRAAGRERLDAMRAELRRSPLWPAIEECGRAMAAARVAETRSNAAKATLARGLALR